MFHNILDLTFVPFCECAGVLLQTELQENVMYILPMRIQRKRNITVKSKENVNI